MVHGFALLCFIEGVACFQCYSELCQDQSVLGVALHTICDNLPEGVILFAFSCGNVVFTVTAGETTNIFWFYYSMRRDVMV